MQEAIDTQPLLSDNLQTYLSTKPATNDHPQALNPWVSAYLLVVWILEADSACEGFGVPFDRSHLMFYQ